MAVMCVLISVLVWLRWYSGLWEYRWTGFGFGLVVALCTLRSRGTAQAQIDFARKYNVPKRVSVIGNIAGVAIGTSLMWSFFTGKAVFFSAGTRARSDDGFFGVVLLASALNETYLFWLLKRNSANHDNKSSVETLIHG